MEKKVCKKQINYWQFIFGLQLMGSALKSLLNAMCRENEYHWKETAHQQSSNAYTGGEFYEREKG